MNRGSQPAARPAQSPAAATTSNGSKAPHRVGKSPAWLRVMWIVLLFAATILVVSIAFLLYVGGPKEGNFVDKKKQQAVFLTNGQVYFGHIKEVNKQYINLTGIYYLNVNQQVQPDQKDKNATNTNSNSSISLVKLGCELHGPVDQMLINRDQVTFWENLKDDGQVAKAISQWVQQNPKGQTCSTPSTNTTTQP
ncbi:MAG TPA: hypothetical protein VLH86_01830 [Patescibacteria group bacterium]|nr:hypothetical protein [Patescibacteria group bacterium]